MCVWVCILSLWRISVLIYCSNKYINKNYVARKEKQRDTRRASILPRSRGAKGRGNDKTIHTVE